MDSTIEEERKEITNFLDNVDFIDLNMQTAIHASYDYTKSLDENLKQYTN